MKLSRNSTLGKIQIIAHRGGVVTPNSPQCSLTAIEKSIETGYDAVELDVRSSSDHVPIVFHDETLQRMCGRAERVEDLPASILKKIGYLNSDESIADLDECLALCAKGGIGIMMEFKASGAAKAFYQSIRELLDKHQLRESTVMFPPKEEVVNFYQGYAPIQQHIGKVREMKHSGLPVDELCFVFEQPWDITEEEVVELNELGVFIIIAINTFQYVRKYRSRNPEDYIEHIRDDINKMTNWGVDSLQIDSVYQKYVIGN